MRLQLQCIYDRRWHAVSNFACAPRHKDEMTKRLKVMLALTRKHRFREVKEGEVLAWFNGQEFIPTTAAKQ